MDKLISFLSKLDYAVSAIMIGYGIYSKDYRYVLGGLLGLGLAKYNLSQRVRTRLENYLIKKRKVEDHSDLLKEHEKLYDESIGTTSKPVLVSFEPRPIVYQSVNLLKSRHNKLLTPGVFEIKANLKNRKC